MMPCVTCGADCTPGRVFAGAVGPFCTVACRDKQEDRKLWERGNAYAERLRNAVGELRNGGELQTSDVARAFVIGFAAGAESQAMSTEVKK